MATLDPLTVRIGFLGLGRMGGRMVPHLVQAGWRLLAFDPLPGPLAAAVAAGVEAAVDTDDTVRRADVVITSLPSSAALVDVADRHLIPNARRGQVFIDMGTTEAGATRRIAAACAANGATFLDAPVSGVPGPGLRVFIGGDPEVAASVRPLLSATADPNRIVYCGPSSTGQAVKAVNQLGMGLVAAACLEAFAFGIRAGADPAAIAQGVGGSDGWRAMITDIARRHAAGSLDDVYVKYPELPSFLDDARAQDIPLPLTAALRAFLEQGEERWRDNMDRPRVALWSMLMSAAADGRLTTAGSPGRTGADTPPWRP